MLLEQAPVEEAWLQLEHEWHNCFWLVLIHSTNLTLVVCINQVAMLLVHHIARVHLIGWWP